MNIFDAFTTLWNSIDILGTNNGVFFGTALVGFIASLSLGLILSKNNTTYFYAIMLMFTSIFAYTSWNKAYVPLLILTSLVVLLPMVFGLGNKIVKFARGKPNE